MERKELFTAFINAMLGLCEGLRILAVDDRMLPSQIQTIHDVFACMEKGLRHVEGDEPYLVAIKQLLAYENKNWPNRPDIKELRDLTYQRVQTIIATMQRLGVDVRLPELRFQPYMHRPVKGFEVDLHGEVRSKMMEVLGQTPQNCILVKEFLDKVKQSIQSADEEGSLKLTRVTFSITENAGHLTVCVEDSGKLWDFPTFRSTDDFKIDCLRAVLFAVTGDDAKHISGFSTFQTNFGYRYSADSPSLGIYFVEEGQAKRFFEYLDVRAGATLVVSENQEVSAFLDPLQGKPLADLIRQVVKEWSSSTIALSEEKVEKVCHLQFPSESLPDQD